MAEFFEEAVDGLKGSMEDGRTGDGRRQSTAREAAHENVQKEQNLGSSGQPHGVHGAAVYPSQWHDAEI